MCKTLTAVSTGIVVLMLVTCKEDVTMQEIDTTPPKITLKKSEVDVSGGREADIGENQLTIGDEAVASWTDDSGKPCKVHLTFKGQDVVS